MSRSTHATYTAADRYERTATRRQAQKLRRQGSRAAVIAAALAEVA